MKIFSFICAFLVFVFVTSASGGGKTDKKRSKLTLNTVIEQFTSCQLEKYHHEESQGCKCLDQVMTDLMQLLKTCNHNIAQIQGQCKDSEALLYINRALLKSLFAHYEVVQAMSNCINNTVGAECQCKKNLSLTLIESLVFCNEAVTRSYECHIYDVREGDEPFCTQLKKMNPNAKTGLYNFRLEKTKEEVKAHCIMNKNLYGCRKSKIWTSVTFFETECPKGFSIYKNAIKGCGRPRNTSSGGCASVLYPAHNMKYRSVCGIVNGYQYGSPDALSGPNRPAGINEAYVDGISITHGTSPRQHIWTYMAASTEREGTCPCASNQTVPSFIGRNYHCESGNTEMEANNGTLYAEDTLWDACLCRYSEVPCCKEGDFSTVLPQVTSDDIELRVCGDEGTNNEDAPFTSVGIFVS